MQRGKADGEKRVVPERHLRLEPGPGNPRNSEGDFVRLKDGRWMLVYTRFYGEGTGSDEDRADLVARYSRDEGRTWTDRDETVVRNEGGRNVMSVTLRRLPDGRLGLFYLRKDSWEACLPLVRFSADEGRTWSEPTGIAKDAPGYYVVNNDRVEVTRSGRLVVPAALHTDGPGTRFKSVARAVCFLSDDSGKTWRLNRGGPLAVPASAGKTGTGLQEPGVVERGDGSLLLWARTDLGTQWVSHSGDGGETWAEPRPGPLRSPASPASIKRVPGTDHLLALWNDAYDDSPAGGWHRGMRTPLAAALSRDGGKTWGPRRILEDDPAGWYCYTAVAFAGERVLLAYCAGKGRADGLKTLQVASVALRETQ